MDLVRVELGDDPTVDITTTGRQTGMPRRLEIWMLDVDGRFFITGTPRERHRSTIRRPAVACSST